MVTVRPTLAENGPRRRTRTRPRGVPSSFPPSLPSSGTFKANSCRNSASCDTSSRVGTGAVAPGASSGCPHCGATSHAAKASSGDTVPPDPSPSPCPSPCPSPFPSPSPCPFALKGPPPNSWYRSCMAQLLMLLRCRCLPGDAEEVWSTGASRKPRHRLLRGCTTAGSSPDAAARSAASEKPGCGCTAAAVRRTAAEQLLVTTICSATRCPPASQARVDTLKGWAIGTAR
mmetsp:Transcript_8599/g.25782  ORF Transcript_8599/g.25782 Transcript_8599/m.25782 type:complete len:230 (+) Transcript_8599:504-1193(+)